MDNATLNRREAKIKFSLFNGVVSCHKGGEKFWKVRKIFVIQKKVNKIEIIHFFSNYNLKNTKLNTGKSLDDPRIYKWAASDGLYEK